MVLQGKTNFLKLPITKRKRFYEWEDKPVFRLGTE